MSSIRKGDVYRYKYGSSKQEWVLEEVVRVTEDVVYIDILNTNDPMLSIDSTEKVDFVTYQRERKEGRLILHKEYKFKRLIEAYEKVKGDMAANT